MPGRSPAIIVTVVQQQVLQECSQAASTSEALKQRSRVILLAFERKRNAEIAESVGLHRNQIGRWRKRWLQAFDHLVNVECSGSIEALRAAIIAVLSDSPRSGRPSSKARMPRDVEAGKLPRL